MAGYLIRETTKEEREQIVADALGNISASCDGCMPGQGPRHFYGLCSKVQSPELNGNQ